MVCQSMRFSGFAGFFGFRRGFLLIFSLRLPRRNKLRLFPFAFQVAFLVLSLNRLQVWSCLVVFYVAGWADATYCDFPMLKTDNGIVGYGRISRIVRSPVKSSLGLRSYKGSMRRKIDHSWEKANLRTSAKTLRLITCRYQRKSRSWA